MKHKNLPLRTCRTCWTGVPVNEFNTYGGKHCDMCQRNKALEALNRIFDASFGSERSHG